MTTAATLAAISAGTAAVGTAVSLKNQREARKEQQAAAESERRRREIINARQRRKAAAQARIQRARIAAEAQARGVSGSSAVQGAQASLSSQLAERVGFSGFQEAAAARTEGFQSNAQSRLGRAATAQALGNLPGQLGITPSFASAFSEPQPTAQTDAELGSFGFDRGDVGL